MILYKYLPPARIDVILNCQIRFTQYGDFNDPFELCPNIDKLAEQDEIRKLLDKNFVRLVEEEYNKHPIISALISKEEFIELAKTNVDSLKDVVVGQEPHIVNMLPGILQKTVNSRLGALSLSEICDHELMWSHYAEEHKGYAIGFDSSHPFFNKKKSHFDELRHLRKINYQDSPPKLNLTKSTADELFFVKSSKWKYEAEWRMLLPLSDSNELIPKDPYSIHLFEFPQEAVKKIILGSQMTENNKHAIRSKITNEVCKFSLELLHARLDSSSYGIVFEEENL